VPLHRELSELEAELSTVRQQYQQQARQLDTSTLDLGNLRAENKQRLEETAYLATLLGEYGRNFESRLHIAELQRHQAPLAAAKLAAENPALTQQERFAPQTALLTASLERLEDVIGGTRFAGSAVDPGGLVKKGTFVMVGPAAVFRTEDGAVIGTVEQRLGSLDPTVVPFADPLDAAAAAGVVGLGDGRLPIDTTLGNAHKVAATQETLVQHFLKGGPVMWPILGIAMAALLVALVKWLALTFVRRPDRRQVGVLLEAVGRGDAGAAATAVKSVRGPTGRMLAAGVEHLDEPPALVEEVMYETVLATRLRLQSWLPFVAITSSSAPLLGLLGTVTGIMNTFTLMTVFGTGDVKTLSSGISEALITTEYGLYVAIPSLLLYAFLSRKARRIVDEMEQAAVAFVNQVSKSQGRRDAQPAAASA
jgi:biopolymer transport protein ExbB